MNVKERQIIKSSLCLYYTLMHIISIPTHTHTHIPRRAIKHIARPPPPCCVYPSPSPSPFSSSSLCSSPSSPSPSAAAALLHPPPQHPSHPWETYMPMPMHSAPLLPLPLSSPLVNAKSWTTSCINPTFGMATHPMQILPKLLAPNSPS